MATIVKEFSLGAGADAVWDALRDFGALHTRLVPGFVMNTTLDGDVRTVTSSARCGNTRTDSPQNRYHIDPKELVRIQREARGREEDIVGFYHSHPDHPAQPSQYDQDHAWPWYSYIIVSVNKGSPQDMTSWRLNDDRHAFSPEGIEIRYSAAV